LGIYVIKPGYFSHSLTVPLLPLLSFPGSDGTVPALPYYMSSHALRGEYVVFLFSN
jgi:hypothetical protein